MSNLDLNSKQWCELVFDGKNKEFGAFAMRSDSAARHNKAMLLVTLLAIIILCLPTLIRFVTPKKTVEKVTEVTTLTDLKQAEVKNEEIKKIDAPPPPPLKSSIKFTAPVIKKDEEVAEEEEIKTQDELTNSKVAISIADVTGNDEINGQDIADLREVAMDEPVEEEPDTPFVAVEQMPQFPGGEAAMQEYLAKNIKYPAIAAENGIEGVVVVRFVVSKTGEIQDVEVLAPVDRALDDEAKRVIRSMPKWIPGKQNGNNVAVYFTAPIRFKLMQQ